MPFWHQALHISPTSHHHSGVMWRSMVNIIWYKASLTLFQRYARIIVAKVVSVLWWKGVFESGKRCRLPKRIAVKACLHSKTRLLQNHVGNKIRCFVVILWCLLVMMFHWSIGTCHITGALIFEYFSNWKTDSASLMAAAILTNARMCGHGNLPTIMCIFSTYYVQSSSFFCRITHVIWMNSTP